ncbi:TrbI/VirB10 family protein [Brucella intermedia]|uniref:TrbI/VirB10 family protein n=1 Tax=Brucella intermedia TaxID=94625 RepID=UPI0004699F2B|nr:conjugal transfer protein TraI [Brucella intermedia]
MTENSTIMDTTAPMRLRAEPPRVTRLSRKMLASVGAVALLGIGGALIYALQTRDGGPGGEELYTTETAPRRTVSPRKEAARLSNVFFQSGPRTGGTAGTAMPGLAGIGALPDGTGQNRHTAFLNGTVDRQTVAPDRVAPLTSPYILQGGAVIPAALITGIRSDLPGQITAQVTENVYDSPTGSMLLIPQGTRIIGQYDDGVTFGQRRVLLVWNRLILPGGRSIVLERLPGADASGYAGLEDGIDYHWWDLMKAAGLSTLLAVGTELATSDEDRLIRAIRDGAQDTVNQAGQQIVQRQLQVAPTLTVRPGFPVRVIVTRDLVFEPAGV